MVAFMLSWISLFFYDSVDSPVARWSIILIALIGILEAYEAEGSASNLGVDVFSCNLERGKHLVETKMKIDDRRVG